jgi:hypothetical protein
VVYHKVVEALAVVHTNQATHGTEMVVDVDLHKVTFTYSGGSLNHGGQGSAAVEAVLVKSMAMMTQLSILLYHLPNGIA